MKYLIIRQGKPARLTDELTFQVMRETGARAIFVYRFKDGFFEELVIPEDWATGDLNWREVK